MKYKCRVEDFYIGSILKCVVDTEFGYEGTEFVVEGYSSDRVGTFGGGKRQYFTMDFMNGVINPEFRMVPWDRVATEDKFIYEMTGKVHHL